MRLGIISAVIFLFFLIEGTVVQVIGAAAWGLSWIITPRFVLVGIVFIGLYLGRRKALVYGLLFGLLYDVVYTDVIGVYAFTMGLTGYLAGLCARYFHQSLLLVTTTILLATFMNEWIVYGLYHLFHMAEVSLNTLLLQEMVPTVLFNTLFALLIFRPMSRMLTAAESKKNQLA
ncbi:rod shape-determining protein MreD [Aneurinibacillus terranovensis]|uniref:rod shape-determining protein MreD n=1 Tax=Aneurinibacillus terranovensis TaxID=278991 RepID=UPI0004133825|nr:rod shape-determining protein MreD [Aneurinibacillus terranovensis]